MHQQRVAGPKLGQEVLRPARDASYGLPLEPAREIRRKLVAQVRASQNDIPNSGASHRALQPSPLVLDFWQFWHNL